MSQIKLTLCLSFLALCVACGFGHDNEPKNWVVLVSGSNGYDNYRHQADVCQLYQTIRSRGIPDENIIVMMYDDIAYNPKNQFKGQIYHKSGGPNVYKNVPRDYIGNAVTVENFLYVLAGVSDKMKNVGSGKVVNGTDKDTIFVFYEDHGAPGVISFIKETLHAADIMEVLEDMKTDKSYGQILFLISACYSGSMFENLLPDNTKVFAITSANSHEPAYGCCYDQKVKAYLSNEFAMGISEILEKGTDMSIAKLYDNVKASVNRSHVQKFGDPKVAESFISTFIGKPKKTHQSEEILEKYKNHRIHNTISDFDVPIAELRRKIETTDSADEKWEYEHQIETILWKRKIVHSLIRDILMDVAENNDEKYLELEQMTYSITRQNMYCVKNITNAFNENCFNISENPYVANVVGDLIKLCDVEWTTEDQITEIIQNICRDHEKPVNVL